MIDFDWLSDCLCDALRWQIANPGRTDGPEIPYAGLRLWGVFMRLHAARGGGGFGPGAITYSEMRALGEPLIARTDGARWQRDHQHRPFKEAVKAAKLDPGFTFHELRHTWASLTVMAGAPLIVVATNLGHRDTRMVERHYGHLTQSYIAETIRQKAPSFGFDEPTNVVSIAGR